MGKRCAINVQWPPLVGARRGDGLLTELVPIANVLDPGRLLERRQAFGCKKGRIGGIAQEGTG